MEPPGIWGNGVRSDSPYHKVDKVAHRILKTKGVEFDLGRGILISVFEYT